MPFVFRLGSATLTINVRTSATVSSVMNTVRIHGLPSVRYVLIGQISLGFSLLLLRRDQNAVKYGISEKSNDEGKQEQGCENGSHRIGSFMAAVPDSR